MLIGTGIITVIAIYFGVRLFSLKKGIESLERDFCEIKKETKKEDHAQRNITIAVPDKSLEKLGFEINDYINQYYQDVAMQKKNVQSLKYEITNLSHDLRTPLTSILGYINLLEDENLTSNQKELYEIIVRKGNQLNELIEQLYEYARLENCDYVYHMEKIDFSRFVKEYLLDSYSEFEANEVTLELDYPKEEVVFVEADRIVLRRILINLTSNALKYAKGYAKVSIQKKGKWIEMTYVTDRGNLSEYDIIHLFDRYYRQEKAKATRKGSGLGLTITKMFIEQMHGTILAQADERNLFISCSFLRI